MSTFRTAGRGLRAPAPPLHTAFKSPSRNPSNSTLSIGAGGGTNSGALNVTAGTLTVSGSLTDTTGGSMSISSGATLSTSGALTNNSGATIVVSGTLTETGTAAISNAGTITL